jgi:hypothetical protein
MIKTHNTNILPAIKDLCKPVLLTNSMNLLVFPSGLAESQKSRSLRRLSLDTN